MTQPAAYTTEGELDAALASDGLTAGNKLHIHVFLTQPHMPKEQVNFLKRVWDRQPFERGFRCFLRPRIL